MSLALRICLAILGVSALAIALSIFTLGAGPTASAAEHVFAALTGWRGPPSEVWPPTMDSELRFYAALWGAFGILALRTGWRLPAHIDLVPWLAGAFFAGGVGRALSYLSVGPPHPVFAVLMAIELVLGPALALLWLGARRRD